MERRPHHRSLFGPWDQRGACDPSPMAPQQADRVSLRHPPERRRRSQGGCCAAQCWSRPRPTSMDARSRRGGVLFCAIQRNPKACIGRQAMSRTINLDNSAEQTMTIDAVKVRSRGLGKRLRPCPGCPKCGVLRFRRIGCQPGNRTAYKAPEWARSFPERGVRCGPKTTKPPAFRPRANEEPWTGGGFG